jgi:hypothetical protein
MLQTHDPKIANSTEFASAVGMRMPCGSTADASLGKNHIRFVSG